MSKHLTTGTRVYNRGDMANPPHWGRITAIGGTEFGQYVEITVDTEEFGAREPGSTYTVPAHMVKHHDRGHHGDRIVTEAAYNAHRDREMLRWGHRAGQAAYDESKPRVLPEGFRGLTETAKEWYRGWDEANLAATDDLRAHLDELRGDLEVTERLVARGVAPASVAESLRRMIAEAEAALHNVD